MYPLCRFILNFANVEGPVNRWKKWAPNQPLNTHLHMHSQACLSHLIVAIAYGKGVVLKEVYEKMDGQFFAQFIRTHFNIAFARSGPKRYGRRPGGGEYSLIWAT